MAYAMLATSNKASQKPQWEVITDGTHYRVRDNSNNWVSKSYDTCGEAMALKLAEMEPQYSSIEQLIAEAKRRAEESKDWKRADCDK